MTRSNEATTRFRPASKLRFGVEFAALVAVIIILPPLLERGLMMLGMDATGFVRIAATGAIFVSLVLLVAIFLRANGERLADIGLRGDSIGRHAVIGVVTAAFLFGLLEALKAGGLMTENRLGDMASELQGNLPLALARIALSILIVGFAEEVIYRGYLMTRLATVFGRSQLGWSAALLVQSALFGLSHGYQGVEGMAFTAGVGFLLGCVVLASGRNLWPAIIGHGVYNGARAAYLYYALTVGPPMLGSG